MAKGREACGLIVLADCTDLRSHRIGQKVWGSLKFASSRPDVNSDSSTIVCK